MARETTQQTTLQDQSRNQQQSAGAQQPPQQAQQAQPSVSGAGTNRPGERERSIDTSRERASTGVSRRPVSSPVYGRGAVGDPFALMQRMAEDMDRLFDQFGFGRTGFGLVPSFGSMSGGGAGRDSRTGGSLLGRSEQTLWSPQVEMFQRGDRIVVRADLPGVKKDDVHVDVENDVLTIRGERREEREENREGLFRSERSYGEFYRAIPLPEGVNADQCDATYHDGVLEVTLAAPKPEEHRARRIQIR